MENGEEETLNLSSVAEAETPYSVGVGTWFRAAAQASCTTHIGWLASLACRAAHGPLAPFFHRASLVFIFALGRRRGGSGAAEQFSWHAWCLHP